jgi:CDP-glycerol glycerophosphotransferase (TagB/SpsB family)
MITDRIIRYFTYIINLPLYYISFFIPKNKNIWVFGAWFGEKYADNSKALFEFVNRHDKEILTVWLTQSQTVFRFLKQKGMNVHYTYSLKGYYYSAIAKFVFVSTGMHDVNRFVSSNNIKVQLWHGTPLKKIMNDVGDVLINRKLLLLFKKIFMPFDFNSYKYLLSSAYNINDSLNSAFLDKIENIIVKGYPRNDQLFSCKKESVITFLPTHRGEGNGGIQQIFNSFDSIKVNSFLIKNNYKLVIKPHFYDLDNVNVVESKTISVIKEDIDLYELLSKTDILITDYSSVYFDFLLLDRPIIFTPFDMKEYINKDRELYYDYDKVTPGPRCMDWNEVMNEIEKLMNGEDNYRGERKKTNNYFNKYQDGNSSKRVYEFFKNMN